MVDQDMMLKFFKALSDANRLKIVSLLARQPLTVEQLAEILQVGPSTVSHHMTVLNNAGLVSARAESYYNVYRLQAGVLESLAHALLSPSGFSGAAANVDVGAYDRKVVANYSLPDGRLKTIPAQQKKLEAVLRYVVSVFEPGVCYTEKQTNELLRRFHDDTASLRRELIGFRLLERDSDGSAYWRAAETNAANHDVDKKEIDMETISEETLMEELLAFYKAVADEERLKVLGLLALSPKTAATLAAELDMRPQVVAAHLGHLEHVGVVRMDNGLARVNGQALQEGKRRLLAGRKTQVNADALDGDAFEKQVLKSFLTADGKLKEIPSQAKKRLVVLRYVQQRLPKEHIPERQLNEMLLAYYNDPASLRRYLVDDKLLQRDHGEYWRND